jgi:hypothetical protein
MHMYMFTNRNTFQCGILINTTASAGQGYFSHCHSVQTGSGAHQASHRVTARDFSPGIKRQEREANHSPLYSVKVKSEWSYTSTPPLRLHSMVLN